MRLRLSEYLFGIVFTRSRTGDLLYHLPNLGLILKGCGLVIRRIAAVCIYNNIPDKGIRAPASQSRCQRWLPLLMGGSDAA
jgi:hypothetical protein